MTSSVAPSVFGQPVTFTSQVVAVAPSVGLPTGNMSFYNGSTLLGTAGLDVTGAASFTTSVLPVGGESITVVYDGDGSFKPSTSSVFIEGVSRALTAATFSGPGVVPVSYGQIVTASTTVSAVAPGAGTPSGMVELLDGSTVVATMALDPTGAANFHVSNLSVGSHTLSIAYLGDAGFDPVASSTITETVNQANTTTQLGVAPSSSVFGQSVTFTATVVGAFQGGSKPSGTVVFQDGSTFLGTGTLDATGAATYTTINLSVANHSITASYVGDPNYLGGISRASGVRVNPAATSAAVSGLPNPSMFGQSVTIFVNVSTIAPGLGVPTGQATLFDGSTNLGNLNLTSGQGSLTIPALSAGTHIFSAIYGGDGTHQGAASSAFIQFVSQATTTLGLNSTVNPSVTGQVTTFIASLSVSAPGAGVAVGSVVFYDGGSPIGAAPLNVGGNATLTASKLGVGSHSITAVFAGNASFTGATSPPISQTVNAATTTTLAASNSPTVYGQSVALWATVSAAAPGMGAPTGSVTFFEGSAPLGTVNLNGSGTASLTLPLLAVGGHSITAVYAGISAFSGSTSSLATHTVNKAGTAAALSSTVLAPVAGQSVTFIFTAPAAAPGAGQPTGSVTFTDGSTPLGTVPMSAGVATFTTSGLAVGSHGVLASYSGDGNFNAGAAPVVNLSVAQEATNTILSAPVSSSVYGQWVTYTATVSAVAPGGVIPAGTVQFFDGATEVASVTPMGGSATYTAVNLTPGGHSITAVYLGGARTLGSNSPALALNVAKDNTRVSFSASTAVYGQPTTVSATITSVAPGAGTPTNVVVFYDNGVQVGSAWVVGGQARASLNLSPVGSTHALTAAYLGDNNFNAATSSAVVRTVAKANTSTVLVSSPVTGGTYLVSAVAGLTPGSGVVGGSVTFAIDGTTLTTQALVNGYAFYFVGPTGQNHTYTATYTGASNFNPSASPPLYLGSSAARAAALRPMAAFSARGSIKASGRFNSAFKF